MGTHCPNLNTYGRSVIASSTLIAPHPWIAGEGR
jgi:hypothetical protein